MNNLVIRNSHRIDDIVKSLLLQTRHEKQKLNLADINKIIENNLDIAYHAMRAVHSGFHVDIHIDLLDIETLYLYKADLDRALLNIFNNAFYAVETKFHNQNLDDRPKVTIKSEKTNDNFLRIIVIDNGIGIPKEIVKEIFTPFFTTKPTDIATGLGLSITNEIITAHRGTIIIDSLDTNYTKFIITLPLNLKSLIDAE